MPKKHIPWSIWPMPKFFRELELFGTADECRGAWMRATMKSGFGPWTIVFALCAGLPAYYYLFPALRLSPLLFPVLIIGCWLACVMMFRGRIQRCLRKELRQRGCAICIKCGYDLRGQVEPRCPECGSPFDANLVNPGTRSDEAKS